MSHKLLSHRVVLGVCALLVSAASGCRTVAASHRVAHDGTVALSTDIDPARAFLPLSKIEPRPTRPAKPETQKPLTKRAARQIPKARKLIGEQRYTEAAIELERALRYDPQHPDIHRTLATLHWEAGNLERARSHAERAVNGNPDDAVSHYIRGRYLARKGDPTAAISDFRTAILCSDFTRDPEIAALCHFHLAEALRADGYLEASIGQYEVHERLVTRIERPFAQAELIGLADGRRRVIREAKADIYESLGRFAKAADALAPSIAAQPDHVELGLRHARLLLRAGRLSEAISAARAIPSDDDEVIELIFEIHERSGKPERIVAELRERTADKPDSERAALQLGRMLVRLDRRAEAREALERFLEQQPFSARARVSLVKVLTESGAWPAALRVCTAGIELDGDMTELLATQLVEAASDGNAFPPIADFDLADADATGVYLLGRVTAALDRVDDAEALLRTAYEHRPEFLPGRVALARLLLDRDRYDEAMAIATRADADAPEDIELELILGEIYERRDQFDRAERHFKAAMQLNRTDLRAMLALADLFRTSGQTLRAQRQLRAMLDVDPNHGTAREMLAYSYLREKKRDVAMEEFEELSKRTTDPTTSARCDALRDHVFKREPDLEAFRTALRTSMEKHGQDPRTWLAIAESYDIDRQSEPRADALRRVLELEPTSEEAAVGLVDAASRLLEFEEATRHLERLASRRPNRHAWRLSAGDRSLGLVDLYWIIQDFDAALRVLSEMRNRNDLEGVWLRRYRMATIDTLRLARREEELTQLLQVWIEEDGDARIYRLILASQYLRREQFGSAVPLLKRVYEESPDDHRTLASLVSTMAKSGDTQSAEQMVLDWLSRDPDNDDAVSLLIRLLGQQERWDDAIELVRNRLVDTLDRERFQDHRIALNLEAKRFDENTDQIESLIDQVVNLLRTVKNFHARIPIELTDRQAFAFLPNEPYTAERLALRLVQLRVHLAQTMIAAKDFRPAESQLTAWLEEAQDPDERLQYLAQLISCLRNSGDEDRATGIVARALALRPSNPGLNNDVAYGWIDQGIRLQDAEPMIRYAVSRRPRTAAYLDTYGWLLYKMGDFEGARKWLLRARVANRTGDPVIHDHLGDTAWRMGQKDEAIENWKVALSSVAERPEERRSQDELRVKETTQQKIDDVLAGRKPAVALLGSESATTEDTEE